MCSNWSKSPINILLYIIQTNVAVGNYPVWWLAPVCNDLPCTWTSKRTPLMYQDYPVWNAHVLSPNDFYYMFKLFMCWAFGHVLVGAWYSNLQCVEAVAVVKVGLRQQCRSKNPLNLWTVSLMCRAVQMPGIQTNIATINHVLRFHLNQLKCPYKFLCEDCTNKVNWSFKSDPVLQTNIKKIFIVLQTL